MKANAKIDDLKMLIKKQKVNHSAKKSSIEAEIKALKTGIQMDKPWDPRLGFFLI